MAFTLKSEVNEIGKEGQERRMPRGRGGGEGREANEDVAMEGKRAKWERGREG